MVSRRKNVTPISPTRSGDLLFRSVAAELTKLPAVGIGCKIAFPTTHRLNVHFLHTGSNVGAFFPEKLFDTVERIKEIFFSQGKNNIISPITFLGNFLPNSLATPKKIESPISRGCCCRESKVFGRRCNIKNGCFNTRRCDAILLAGTIIV